MLSRNSRFILLGLMALLLIAPALAMPGGPPWKSGDNLIVEVGCTCHGDAAPSTDVVVSISGVPRAYTIDQSYEFTVSLQHASNAEGGFMLWDYNIGSLTPGENSRTVTEEPGAISQSAVGNNWVVTWTAPSSDVGIVPFQLVGNAVNGDGIANELDAWNIVSFSISPPDSATNDDDENLALRTISVGDYESLFVAVEDPEAVEAERQEELASTFFDEGNIYYFFTLSIIIVAAVVQGEFYERKFGGGPEHLDKSLAIPQGVRRGAITALLLVTFAWAVDDNQSWQVLLTMGMLVLWGIFGVYRTIVQARAPAQAKDLV
ncbi:MAG: hypothetical protein L7U62_05535 [Candidatus Poseidoniaceae archaeon]|nr:hypothetical protein [Candidatus Poseidoniaceae archaeon]